LNKPIMVFFQVTEQKYTIMGKIEVQSNLC
jgi:hypothetical protein